MKTLKWHLSKLLLGVAIGAMLGALVGWLLMGEGVVVYAILGACVLAALATLYDPNAVHSSPNSRGRPPHTIATLPRTDVAISAP